jgi:hypothetical protein
MNGDDMGDDSELTSGTQTDVETPQPGKPQNLKGVGMKKGPKLAKSMKKVGIRNKTSNKALKKE